MPVRYDIRNKLNYRVIACISPNEKIEKILKKIELDEPEKSH
jgi:hypothetical protein